MQVILSNKLTIMKQIHHFLVRFTIGRNSFFSTVQGDSINSKITRSNKYNENNNENLESTTFLQFM